MALLLCLMILTLPVISSTVWAAGSELSDAYVLSDDVVPYAAVSDLLSIDDALPYQVLEYLRAFVNKLPLTKHYVACPTVSFWGSEPNMLVFDIYLFDDYSYSYETLTVSGDYLDCYTIYCFWPLSYPYEQTLFYVGGSHYKQLTVTPSDRTATLTSGYSDRQDTYITSFSDVGDVFPDISNRGEVRVQYATIFSLAVFFLFDRLVALWRSIRGRDT